MTKELLQYLNVAENLFYYNNTNMGTPIYNTVLHFLVESKEVSAYGPCTLSVAIEELPYLC